MEVRRMSLVRAIRMIVVMLSFLVFLQGLVEAREPVNPVFPKDIETAKVGKERVKVAILDSGSNTAFKEGISLIDGTLKDYNGHGTLTAQIIKESCPNAELYIIKVIGKDGLVINEDAVILGLEWAVAKDVKVINMSLRIKPSQRLYEVIKKAYAKGIILVAAAGNNDKFSGSYYSLLDAKTSVDSIVPSKEVAYPAKYTEVIAVGALDQYGKVYNESAQSEEVDLNFRGYRGRRAGTSIASAYAAGHVAKIISGNPDLGINELRSFIHQQFIK
jgi:minor extracellular protease Epr